MNYKTEEILFHLFTMKMAYMDRKIPLNVFYSAIVGEIFMITLSTLRFSDFLPKICEMVSRIIRLGGKVRKCHSSLKKIINKNQEDFSKLDDNYFNSANYFIRQILLK